jgi:predicted GNAT family acetyltransferase
MMKLSHHAFDDPVAFAAAVKPFLMEREAEHGLLLGLTATLARPGSSYTGRNHLALVAENGSVQGVLLMTPPFGPVISNVGHPAGVEELVEGLASRQDEVPGIFGTDTVSAAFAAVWRERTGRAMTTALRERVYQLTRVVSPPTMLAGGARVATSADRDLLIRWLSGFNADAFGDGSPEVERAGLIIDARLRDPGAGFLIWEDGGPVAMAGFCDPTPHGTRIGPVYTPKIYRGRGYGSAVTAALAQQLLDRGNAFVFLFTDMANAISNHMYVKIGFEPVADYQLWETGAA